MITHLVSIVVPLYNEQDNVRPLCVAVREALSTVPWDYELILVDDGSTDETPGRLREEADADPRVRFLRLNRNSGQTLAMATGFRASRGRVIVSMDGDLQNDPADIPMLVARLDAGHGVVCGWRKNRKDRWISRTLPSKIANRLISWLTGIPIHDNGCSLKAYRAEVVRSLNLYSEMHRFLPAMSSMTGASIAEVVVNHRPRIHGESKYGIGRTFKVLADMITIKMITQFSSRPGVWFGLLAIPWLLLGLAATGFWFSALRGDGSPSIVFPALAVSFFYVFFHLIALQVLSEMLLTHADRTHMRRLSHVLIFEAKLDPANPR